ncbi:TetR/AcrR family transcriptional regulator [Metabacillus malikii]|uniref:AcrR family transcriptional regulator n=1 Tax=Metabacillus malikii TaxID=1504265 RepID=A0ABT9ZDU8_9BACI|nr:TetR/AcrR family transcriptional regulator [Metabacillus malikii]MDQ0230190.1 AcrR family transcriptional regulator [Metabacillus malikii]
MPKQTFFKLTEEKQKKLIDAAIKEFSNASFDEVKISNIIKQANIPRSSFYDYFDDKEDLFLHLLEIVKETKQTYMSFYVEKQSSSFFDKIRTLLIAGASFAAEHPEYEKFANKLYENKKLMKELLGETKQDILAIYKELIKTGIESGELKQNLDPSLIAQCIYHLTANLFVDDFTKDSKGTIHQKVDKLLSFIKNGIAN